MTKFKRFLSCFLALTMVLGMFSGMGAMFAVDASAAEGTSQVKSYAELKAQYGDFIYYGIDVMEIAADGTETYTDFYVNAGDTLKILHYIKSTRYIGNVDLFLEFDSEFFDITTNGVYDDQVTAVLNADHPIVGSSSATKDTARGFSATMNGADLYADYMYDMLGFSDEYMASVDSQCIVGTMDDTVDPRAAEVTSDLHLIEQTVKVKEGLADGTEGQIRNVWKFWIPSDLENGDLYADVAHTGYTTETTESSAGDCYYYYENENPVAADKYILDTDRTFTIGEAPAPGSKYTAKFMDGTTEVSSAQYAAGANITVPTVADKADAKFAGWALEGSTDIVTSFVMGSANVTYVAIWKYAATFKADGSADQVAYYLPGEQITIPGVPAKTGYDGAWDNTTTVMGNAPITFNAVYTAKTYTVTYKTAAGTETKSVAFDAAYPTTALSTKLTGNIFLGWYIGDTKVTLGTTKHTVAGNVTIEAKYELGKYTATFKANGGIFSENSTDTYKVNNVVFGTTITPPANPTRAGYTFNGWEPTVGTMDAEGKEYTATWTANKVVYTFYDSDKTTVLQVIDDKIYGEIVNPNAPSKQGYTFAGWEDANGNALTFPTTCGTASVDAYAKWNANDIILTFTDAEYNSFHKTLTLKAGSEMKVPDGEPTVTGKTFAGWVDTNGDPIPETVPTVNTTYYASFGTAMYKLTFYGADGEELWSQSLAAGTQISEAPVTAPEVVGHTFSMWVSKSTGNEQPFPFTLNKALELQAKYTVNTHNVYWYVDNELVHTTPDVPYGSTFEDYTYTPPTGKNFSGWEEHSNVMPDADVTIKGYCDAVPYYITFTINGEYHDKLSFTLGEVPSAPDYEKPEGYDFSGWTLPTKMPAQDLTINATLTKHSYVINFYTYEGQGWLGSQELSFGDKINYPADLVINGKDFKGWALPNGDIAPELMPALENTGDVLNITAILVDHPYVIKFIGHEGAPILDTTNTWNKQVTTVEGSGNTVVPTAPEVEGYTFKYWTLNGNKATFPQTIQSDLTYIAYYEINKHQLIYKIDGEVYGEPATYPYGAELPDAPVVDIPGYTFSGWAPATPETMPDNDVIIEGTLTPINYDAKFFGEDGTTPIGDPVSTPFGTSPVAPSEDMIPEKPGYEFYGWKLIGGDDTVYRSDALPKMVVGGASYKAYYSAGLVDYTVIINVMGLDGVYAQESSNVLEGEADTLVTYPAEAREGFTIAADSVYSGKLAADGSTVFTVNYERNKYTITYKSVEWDADVVKTYYFGEAVEEVAAPDKEGYTNNGWDVTIPETMTAGDIVATAQYAINTYTITFDTVGGTNVGAITAEFGKEITAPADPTKEGHKFLGWKKGEAAYTIPGTMPAESFTLVADWETLKYTITFNTDGGTEIPEINDFYGAEIVMPENPVKEGHTFLNWTPAIPTTMPAQNMEITANWNVNQYDATFVDIDGNGKTLPVPTDFGVAPVAPAATKLGHKFVAWVAEDGTEYALGVALPVMVVDGATYTAKFAPLTYDAIFKLDGGNIDGNTADVPVPTVFGEKIEAPADPVRATYIFAGWEPEVGIMDAEGKTFVAKWDQDLTARRVQNVERITTPVYGITFAAYEVKVLGSPIKLQIAELGADGTPNITWTYDRIEYELNEVVSVDENGVPSDVGLIGIKAYNAEDVEVAYGSAETAYEVWTVSACLAAGAHKVRVKVDTSADSWEQLAYGYDYDMAYDEAPKPVDMIKQADISNSTIVRGDATTLTIKTDKTVNRIRLQLDDTTYVTYTPTTTGSVQYSVDGDVATWVITIIFTYEGEAAEVAQTWNIYYRVEGSNTYVKGEADDKYDITIIRFVESDTEVEGQEPFSIISVSADAEVARAAYTDITIETTADVTKLRLVNGSRASTFLQTSNNVTYTVDEATGIATWVIRYRFATLGEQTWNVLCRGNAWSEANAEDAFTITVNPAS